MNPRVVQKAAWYWDRLRAMDAREVALRVRARFRAQADRHPPREWPSANNPKPDLARWPQLPAASTAPPELREALADDRVKLLAGRWRFFRHLPVTVPLPPDWHHDYLANKPVPAELPGFDLDHRSLPAGADVKCLWELSRWQHLTRLALAAHVLSKPDTSRIVAECLDDWIKKNPAFRGWNWTSALESGMRLLQIAWIDAALPPSSIQNVFSRIVAPHVHFTWRHRTFGSSANNHLLGELAGLLAAIARWPEAARFAASPARLQREWEREVLRQFAPDGGNREQALNYQLYSFELCLHARHALESIGLPISSEVRDRLAAAAAFFVYVQSPADAWDYGDSDEAFALPLAIHEASLPEEWRRWLAGDRSPALAYWLGTSSFSPADSSAGTWRIFPDSGYAIHCSRRLFLRLDASPLGYLQTAAHGHCDALHLSLWIDGIAVVIDPGTGGYYGDLLNRTVLADWAAHNGPLPLDQSVPVRRGPFLWSQHHPVPELAASGDRAIEARRSNPEHIPVTRRVTVDSEEHVTVYDSAGMGFSLHWQFPPDAVITTLSPTRFLVVRGTASVRLDLSAEPFVTLRTSILEAPCSPAFRYVTTSPVLHAELSGKGACGCRTTFVASPTLSS